MIWCMIEMTLRDLCFLSCALLAFGITVASPRRVSLRTGDIELRQLSPLTGGAVAARSASSAAQSAASYVTGSDSAARRELFLVSYTDAAHAATLQSSFWDGGAAVLSYIPDNTLLVAATPNRVAQICSQLGAAAAALGPEHRISPDWQPLMEATPTTTATTTASATPGTPTATTTSQSPSSDDSNSTAAAPSQDHQQQQKGWLLVAQARARTAELLAQMRTLSTTSGNTTGGATESAAPAPSAAPSLRYGVAVDLLPGLSAEDLAAVRAEWPGDLEAELRASAGDGAGGAELGQQQQQQQGVSEPACSPLVDVPPPAPETTDPSMTTSFGGSGSGGPTTVSVYLCEKDLAAGVRWLAQRAEVKWVAPLRGARAANARSSILLQTGQITLGQYQEVMSEAEPASHWPYWAAGLQGQGEIVGVGDTGLDVEHCAFADPRFNGSYQAALDSPTVAVLGIASYEQIREHRKVVQYARMGVFGDYGDMSAHGTLVCGSIAGAVLSQPEDPQSAVHVDDATGAAPRARLSFIDTQGGDGGGGTMLWVPYDVYRLYLPLHRQAGAFITSDSWGSDGAGYETQSQSFDRFLWENPDFISLLSAGNEGARSMARFTVAAPSLAKNVVAVGAGSRLPPSLGFRSILSVQGVRLDGSSFSKPVFPWENYNLPTLASISTRAQRPIPMAVALPVDACSPLRNPAAAVKGSVVLALRGNGECDAAEQARNVAAAGAAALMIVQLPPNDPEVPDPVDADGKYVVQSLGVSMLDWDMGLTLIGFIYEGGKLNITRRSVPIDANTVSSFSSWGPTPDGRIKPDIIAPGEHITSVLTSRLSALYGSDACSTRDYSGTSASTPLAAGHVALMRQYLRSGFYPTGSPTDPQSSPFTPSGMLLKALLIAGATSMEGGWALNAGRPLGPAPDGFQGWGRLNLAASLPLAGFTDPRVRLQLVDRGEFRAAGQSVTLTGLTATGSGPVTAVLAYYDYPADPNALTALVNDLNLELWAGEVAYLGNNPEDAALKP
ncbi:hypothetical protein PLESTM_001603100 [Pleodorina starrii]|nr:hypothetical protein PLESTM_001603100 [Pleodorina starrii]